MKRLQIVVTVICRQETFSIVIQSDRVTRCSQVHGTMYCVLVLVRQLRRYSTPYSSTFVRLNKKLPSCLQCYLILEVHQYKGRVHSTLVSTVLLVHRSTYEAQPLPVPSTGSSGTRKHSRKRVLYWSTGVLSQRLLNGFKFYWPYCEHSSSRNLRTNTVKYYYRQ